MHNATPLLSIAIPTYNRGDLLQVCLQTITSQCSEHAEEIEILISNNASTDHTQEVVESYVDCGYPIKYYSNNTNLGPDYNIKRCFELASGKYVWIFSDDDLILPNAINRLLPLLRNHHFGIITLAPNFYREIINKEAYPSDVFEWREYRDPMQHLTARHFWLTYISGTIVNKKALDLSSISFPRLDSFLVQLAWVLPALFCKLPGAEIKSDLILGRSLAVLDFKLFHVFGASYPKVLKFLCRKGQLPQKGKDRLIELIMTDYFPMYIRHDYEYTHDEKPFTILLKSFWNRKTFWQILFPLFVKRRILIICRRMATMRKAQG